MVNKTKYTRNSRLRRDCEKCKHYGGMLSKHYYLCTGEVYVNQQKIATRNIYDIDVKKKGSCFMYRPKEVTNDILSNYITMECCIEKDDQSISDEE